MKKYIPITMALLVGGMITVACSAIRSTGRYPSKKQQQVFESLPNYRNERFQNQYPPLDTIKKAAVPRSKFRKERYSRFKKPVLSQKIPSVKTQLEDTSFTTPTIIWFGHSSYLIQSKGFNILVDPVFSGYGSPLRFVNWNFEGSNIYTLKDLPDIDWLVLTHDHYDHMDDKTIRALRKHVDHVTVPLGVDRTMRYWKYDKDQLHVVNWSDTVSIAPDIMLVSTPAQHFSGRRNKKNKTLWSSYVLDIHGYRLFLGGDGGYQLHFKDIGNKYGPFDLALLENGQYSPYWPSSHCYPEQTAAAALDLQADMIFPIHWAKFSATYHVWNEPVMRLLPVADSLNIPVTIPKIGEPYTIGEPVKRTVWWNFD